MYDDVEDEYEEKPFGHTNWGEKASILFVILLVMGFGFFYLWGMTMGGDQARRILTEEGYTEIEIAIGSVWGCGEGDWKKTTFRAKNQAGNTVRGIVCCGVTKGCTVRRK